MSLAWIFETARNGIARASTFGRRAGPAARSSSTLEPLEPILEEQAEPAAEDTIDNLMATVTEPERRSTAAARADILAVVEACRAAKRPEAAAGFLRDGLGLDAVKQRLADSMPPNGSAAVQRNAQAIIAECEAAGVPYLAAGLIGGNIALTEARSRIAAAGEIQGAVALAAKISPTAVNASQAKDFVLAGASIAHVRSRIFDALASAQEAQPTDGILPAGVGATGNGWDRAIETVNRGR